MFLSIALGLLLFSSCKDDDGGKTVDFDQGTVLQVEVQQYVDNGESFESKMFVFLTDANQAVIGSTEVADNETFAIVNEIPYDGSAFDVHIARVYRENSSKPWRFDVKSYTGVDAPKIYLKGRKTLQPLITGKANFHIDVSNYDHFRIQAITDGVYCDDVIANDCETDLSLSLPSGDNDVLVGFFNIAENEWRYGLLPSVKVGDNITISDNDLPYTTEPKFLDYDYAQVGNYHLYGYKGFSTDWYDGYNLVVGVQPSQLQSAYYAFAPVEALSTFTTHFFMLKNEINESYVLDVVGDPVYSFHPEPVDFEVTGNGESATLTTTSSNASYYVVRWYKSAEDKGSIYWDLYSDMTQPYALPELPASVKDFMPDELQDTDFHLHSAASVRDTWYENLSALVNAELVSELNLILNSDHVTEKRTKEY